MRSNRAVALARLFEAPSEKSNKCAKETLLKMGRAVFSSSAMRKRWMTRAHGPRSTHMSSQSIDHKGSAHLTPAPTHPPTHRDGKVRAACRRRWCDWGCARVGLLRRIPAAFVVGYCWRSSHQRWQQQQQHHHRSTRMPPLWLSLPLARGATYSHSLVRSIDRSIDRWVYDTIPR